MTHSSFPIRPPVVQGQKERQASSMHRHLQTAARKFPSPGAGSWQRRLNYIQAYLFYSLFWAGLLLRKSYSILPWATKISSRGWGLRGITRHFFSMIKVILFSEILSHVSQRARKTEKELSFANWTCKTYMVLVRLVSYIGISSSWARFWLIQFLNLFKIKYDCIEDLTVISPILFVVLKLWARRVQVCLDKLIYFHAKCLSWISVIKLNYFWY